MGEGSIQINNKKARFEFELLDKFTAGIQLSGTEIKSIRNSKASINEAYCFLHQGELYVRNMHIAIYEPASYNNHEERRERKLLLNKAELEKVEKKLKDKGITIVPLRLFIAKSGYAKLDIALARGKKLHDKREDLKQKDAQREMDRAKKSY